MTKKPPKPSSAAELCETPDVLGQLERILSSPLFQHSKRYPAFLRYVVEQTVSGGTADLKERTLGIAVFRRSPDYDTSADPVVRNTASEVRKRLDEYYSVPDHRNELRISLPTGGYIPGFTWTGEEDRVEAKEVHGNVTRAAFRWRPLALGVLLVAALGFLWAIELSPLRTPSKLFWSPVLEAGDPVLVVMDTRVLPRKNPAAESGDSQAPQNIIDPKTFLNVSQESAKLASFLLVNGKHVDYELSRNVTLATLRSRPFVLKGAFNNQWTQRAVAPFRFYFQFDREHLVRRIVDRQNPDKQNWIAPIAANLTEDYALVARAHDPETGEMMIVIAGLSEKGSSAALEFVTNPKYLDQFAAQSPSDWAHRNVEVVIKSNLVNDEWGEPHIVATHYW